MKLVHNLTALNAELRNGAVSIGNFDGVHRGHARIIERLIEQARRVDGPAVVFTFDPHPVRLLRPDHAPPPLTWTARKAQLLDKLGVDAMLAYPTDQALLNLSPQEFFDRLLVEKLAARALVEGPNFRFGHERTGTIETLRRQAADVDMALEVVEPLELDGEMVSSSRVRKLISEGQVAEAARLLTEPYRVRGLVTHGAGRGAQLGFPTANVAAIDTLVPGPGVYAGRALVGNRWWPAAANIGPSPTFGEYSAKFEVHLIGFDDTLYGETLEVELLDRIRDIHSFAGADALKAQLQQDISTARRIAERTDDKLASKPGSNS